MKDSSSSAIEHQRGCQLIDLKRYNEAEAAFRGILARDPQDAWALHFLALAVWRQDRAAEALPIVMGALGADPECSHHQVLRSHILASLQRLNEALQAADEAVRLDPSSADAFAARAQALSGQTQWPACEEAAREALARDPEHTLANHYLAHALRLRGKKHENASVVQEQLRRDPDDPLAHANAGWSALERGDHKKAQEHFANALRLAPDLEWARDGLLHSFRARSPLYSAYLAYNLWISKRQTGHQWIIILGLWLGIKFARLLLTGNLRWLGLGLMFAYLAFVVWVWVARGVGNLLLLTDRFARMVLRRHEKLEAVFVGGGVFLGLLVATLGFLLPNGGLLLAGMLWAVAAIPLACTFDNTSVIGRWLFGTIGCFAWVLAFVVLSAPYLPPTAAEPTVNLALAAFPIVMFAAIGSTWIGNISALRKRN